MLRLVLSIGFLLLVSTVSAQNQIPVLNSNPGANLTIYLDFNGHTTKGTYWNGYTYQENVNGTPITKTVPDAVETPAYNHPEWIEKIWARVAEDYAPFNVNVTTYLSDEKQEGFEDSLIRTTYSDEQYGVRAAIGGKGEWYSRAGGVAFVDIFDRFGGQANSYYGPAFVFSDNVSGEKSTAEAISHEVGHNLGLNHDGETNGDGEYYWGDNGWAPIMGAGYNQAVTQWSKGDYNNATNKQDDLAILSNYLSYREDDFGSSRDKNDNIINGTAALLENYVNETITDPLLKSFYVEGFIEQNTDVDMFEFTLGEGDDFTFSVDSGIWHETDATLDVLAKLYFGEEMEMLYTWDPTDTMGITEVVLSEILGILEAGTYFLSLQGTGLAGFYTDYASLGTYALSALINYGEDADPNGEGDNAVPEPATLTMLGLGLVGLGLARRRRK